MANPTRLINRNSGMTLMELIVATVLVGIVMVGTLSVDSAVHSIRNTTSNSANTAIQTSATMLSITNNISKAVGDAQNLGIVVDNPACAIGSPCRSWFCARQDINSTPNTYTDDRWACFWKPSGSADPNIYSCNRTAGPGDCSGAPATNIKAIGTAACSIADCSTYFFTFYLANDPVNHQFFFDINLTNYPFPTRAVNPLKNPAYQLSSHISPMGHSY